MGLFRPATTSDITPEEQFALSAAVNSPENRAEVFFEQGKIAEGTKVLQDAQKAGFEIDPAFLSKYDIELDNQNVELDDLPESNSEQITKLITQADNVDRVVEAGSRKIPQSITSANVDVKRNFLTALKDGFGQADQPDVNFNNVSGIVNGALNGFPSDPLIEGAGRVASLAKKITNSSVDERSILQFPGELSNITNPVASVAADIGDAVTDLSEQFSFDSLTDPVEDLLTAGSDKVVDVGFQAYNSLSNLIKGSAPINTLNAITDFNLPLTDIQGLAAIGNKIFSKASAIAGGIATNVNQHLSKIGNITNTINSTVGDTLDGLTDAVGGIAESAIGGVNNAIGGLGASIGSATSNLFDGITNNLPSGTDVFSGLANNITDKLKLNSASFVFNGDETSLFSGETIFNGLIDKAKSTVSDQITDLISGISSTVGKSFVKYDLDKIIGAEQILNTEEQVVEVIDIQASTKNLVNVSSDDINQVVKASGDLLNESALSIALNVQNTDDISAAYLSVSQDIVSEEVALENNNFVETAENSNNEIVT